MRAFGSASEALFGVPWERMGTRWRSLQSSSRRQKWVSCVGASPAGPPQRSLRPPNRHVSTSTTAAPSSCGPSAATSPPTSRPPVARACHIGSLTEDRPHPRTVQHRPRQPAPRARGQAAPPTSATGPGRPRTPAAAPTRQGHPSPTSPTARAARWPPATRTRIGPDATSPAAPSPADSASAATTPATPASPPGSACGLATPSAASAAFLVSPAPHAARHPPLPDINRLYAECHWEPKQQRMVRRTA